MNADGTNPVAVTTCGGDCRPTFSPDGTQIAFADNRDGPELDIYVINLDGTNLRRLTDAVGNDSWPSYSPDGSEIAFVSRREAVHRKST